MAIASPIVFVVRSAPARSGRSGRWLWGCRREALPEPLETASDTGVDERVADANPDTSDEARIVLDAQIDLRSPEFLEASLDRLGLARFKWQSAGHRGGDHASPSVEKGPVLSADRRQEAHPTARQEQLAKIHELAADPRGE